MMAVREHALVKVGSARAACSGRMDSGTPWPSLGVGGPDFMSSGSYSKTSGMLLSLGEYGAERGVPGSRDMSGREGACGCD